MEVFPRLRKPEAEPVVWTMMKSGVESVDRLLGGGLYRGTSCLLVGTAGTGKTALTTLFLHETLRQGNRAALFLFEEHPEMYIRRAETLGFALQAHAESNLLHVRSMDTGEISPGEFAHRVKDAVDEGARVVVIDSLTGYVQAMPHGRLLIAQMHEMLRYLRRRKVLCLLTVAQHGLIGPGTRTGAEVSYIADTILLLRYFELEGRVHKAISVLKNRYGSHERTVRRLEISSDGVEVGEPVMSIQGVLSGYPVDSDDETEDDFTSGDNGFSNIRDESTSPQ